MQLTQRTQIALISVYYAIVMFGSFCGHTAWLGAEGAHYFAKRGNLVNQLFVKRGWFWFSLVFWLSYFGRLHRTNLGRAFKRYAAATLYWVLFTQWCFGLPLMDKIFILTGGHCVYEPDVAKPSAISSATCRKGGGSWSGGHDPSGHVFLLVLSSLVLWMEILPGILEFQRTGRMLEGAVVAPLSLLLLWAFMLYFTSVYFHSFAEKASGLLMATSEIVLVYMREHDVEERLAERLQSNREDDSPVEMTNETEIIN